MHWRKAGIAEAGCKFAQAAEAFLGVLDGYTLHIRRLGSPRTWDLRRFRRIEVGTTALPRVDGAAP